MASLALPILVNFTSLLLLLLILFSSAAASKDLVTSACAHATYPNICLKTLSSYSGPANSPNDLAKAGVKVSLTIATRTSEFMTQLKTQSKKDKGPLSDCVEQIGDSVDELRKTLSELQNLGNSGRGSRGISGFRWQMSNVETWVSAALTNEYTCLDGFKEVDGKVRADVKLKIINVARVTSNALYLIHCLDK